MDNSQDIVAKILEGFATAFEDEKGVWNAMAKYCCFLSGSRSLGFFVSGSCNEKSDWDFYIVPNGHCIVGMIKAFEASGVKFASPFDPLLTAFDTGGVCHLTRWQAENLVDCFKFMDDAVNAQFNDRIPIIIECLKKAVDRDANLMKEFCESDGAGSYCTLVVEAENLAQYKHHPGQHVIRGETANGQRLQLMYAPNTSTTDHILRFHSSIVQSFISPYGAGHLYSDLAENKQGWIWNGNNTKASLLGNAQSGRHEAALQKYRDRGFQLEVRPHHPLEARKRDLSQAPWSFFIPLPQMHEVDSAINAERIRQLAALSWYEHHDRTAPRASETQSEPGPRQKSSSKRTLFGDARAICEKHVISENRVRWAHPDSILRL